MMAMPNKRTTTMTARRLPFELVAVSRAKTNGDGGVDQPGPSRRGDDGDLGDLSLE